MNEDKTKDKITKFLGFQVKNKIISTTIGTNNIVQQDQRTSVSMMDMVYYQSKSTNESDDEQQQQPPPHSVENNELNNSMRLQTSYCSTHSNESDLSIALELEFNAINMNIESDELPAFQIRAMSPLGRSPSPIDTCNLSEIDIDLEETPTRSNQTQYPNPCQDDPNFVALHEINAQISPPSDDGSDTNNVTLSRANSLETIFENIFLHTPPHQQRMNGGGQHKGAASHTPKRRRTNLFELLSLNRLHAGKENQSPGVNLPTTPKLKPKEELLQLSPTFAAEAREVLLDSNSNRNTQVVSVAADSKVTATSDSPVMIEWNANQPNIE